MKKILMLFTVLLTAFTVAGCAGNKVDKGVKESYSYKYLTENMGENYLLLIENNDVLNIEVQIAEKNGSFSIKTISGDNDSTVIRNSDGVYILDNKAKEYRKADANEYVESITSYLDTISAMDQPEITQSSVSQADGVYKYEVFDDGASKLKFTYRDDVLVSVVSTINSVDSKYEIKELTTDVPNSLFEVPEDYTVVD